MYSLPDFSNFKLSSCGHTNGETALAGSNSFQYPPSTSSPFLTLGSGFCEKPSIRSPCEQNYRQYSNSYRKSNFFVKDPNQYRFSCDTCNKSFSSQNKLDKHISEHVKCNYEGCFFRGHIKIVELHKKMQHYSGLATRISKLNTPEEIQKWREERRRNFPTAANIKKRQEEQAARRARGEILDTNHFRKRGNRQTRNHNYRWNANSFRHHNNRDKSSFVKRRRRRRQKFCNGAKNISSQSSEHTTENNRFPPQQTNHKSSNKYLQKSEISETQIQRTDVKLVKFPGTKAIEINDEHSELKLEFGKCQDNFQQNQMTLKENNSNGLPSAENESVEKSVININGISGIISDSEVEDAYVAPISVLSNNGCNASSISNNLINERDNDQRNSGILDAQDSDECYEDSTATGGKSSTLSFFTADKEIADSDDEPPIVPQIVKSEPSTNLSLHTKVGGVLGSLMAAYGSDSSENESKDEPVSKPLEVQTMEKKDCSYTKKTMLPPPTPHISRRRLTLLEKLLANEIRHERNVIFQCVNYIVKNNFFDKSD